MVTIVEKPCSGKLFKLMTLILEHLNYNILGIYYFVFLNLGFLISEKNACFG